MDDTTAKIEDAAGIAEVMRDRAALYGLLGRVLQREVDAAFLEQLRHARFPQGSGNDEFDAAFKQMYAFLRHAREDVLDVLAVDYARTFLGSGVLNGNAAFPYESVYTSEHNLVMQDARDQVRAIYAAHDMAPGAGWTDPEDHLALELQYMQALCSRTADALGRGADEALVSRLLGDQAAFLELHLCNWVSRFCADVQRFARTDFYLAAARLAATFVANDQALVTDIAGACGVDVQQAVDAARAADKAVSDDMAAEAAKDHTQPNVVITEDESGAYVINPFDQPEE